MGFRVWSASYDPFGRAAVQSDPDGNGQAVTLNLRFPGQYFDQETGLHYNYFRDYDPAIGRYLSPDPLGLAGGGINLYVYALNDPVNLMDLTGLRPLAACEKDALRPYIPEVDLQNADLHDGEVPFYLPRDKIGITRGNDIYFRPGAYNSSTAGGLALLGHELVHVGQYRNGATAASFLWSYRNGYENSPYEKEAFKLEDQIRNDLTSSGGGGCHPCGQ